MYKRQSEDWSTSRYVLKQAVLTDRTTVSNYSSFSYFFLQINLKRSTYTSISALGQTRYITSSYVPYFVLHTKTLVPPLASGQFRTSFGSRYFGSLCNGNTIFLLFYCNLVCNRSYYFVRNQECSRSVSYTHLDVYKRQVLQRGRLPHTFL